LVGLGVGLLSFFVAGAPAFLGDLDLVRRRGERERERPRFAAPGDLPRLPGDFERDLSFAGLLPLALAAGIFGDLEPSFAFGLKSLFGFWSILAARPPLRPVRDVEEDEEDDDELDPEEDELDPDDDDELEEELDELDDLDFFFSSPLLGFAIGEEMVLRLLLRNRSRVRQHG